jgi:thiaminase (transcriptional activator TenA)
VEREMHGKILNSFGVDAKRAERAEMAPTNAAYTNHLLVSVERLSFEEGLAAMLPCYWIYAEVGKELKKRGSPKPQYQRWIDQYSGEDYAKVVREVLEIMNASSGSMTPAQRERCLKLFERSARYEYMFWDMAWKEESWPP